MRRYASKIHGPRKPTMSIHQMKKK